MRLQERGAYPEQTVLQSIFLQNTHSCLQKRSPQTHCLVHSAANLQSLPLNLAAGDKVRLRLISSETDLAVVPISFAIWAKDALRKIPASMAVRSDNPKRLISTCFPQIVTKIILSWHKMRRNILTR